MAAKQKLREAVQMGRGEDALGPALQSGGYFLRDRPIHRSFLPDYGGFWHATFIQTLTISY